jgi:hypothetical protein
MHGPSDSYKSGTKRHYRRRVWNLLESKEPMASTQKNDRVVVLLDEWQALESRYLIEQRGYRPDQIHAVNVSPAKAARITLSLKEAGHSGVRVHSRGVGAACEALYKQSVKVHALHLDFCCNVTSPDLGDWLADCRSVVGQDPVAVAVNLLRGRETEGWAATRDSYRRMGCSQAEDFARVRLVMHDLCGALGEKKMSCSCHPWHLEWDKYKSTNGQTMIFMVCSLWSHASSWRSSFYRQWLQQEIGRRLRREQWTTTSLQLPHCAMMLRLHKLNFDQLATTMLALSHGDTNCGGAVFDAGRLHHQSLSLMQRLALKPLDRLIAKYRAKAMTDPKHIDNIYKDCDLSGEAA